LSRAITESRVLPAILGWSQLSAVKAGRVFAVDGNAYFNRSGPRLVDSLEILAHLLHPTMFAPGPAGTWCRLETRDGALVEVAT
jgi:iron complex transport system substrate-binding protein